MLYLVAVLLPPLAVLLAGKPFQAILNGGVSGSVRRAGELRRGGPRGMIPTV